MNEYSYQEATEMVEYLGSLYQRCLIDLEDDHKRSYVDRMDIILDVLGTPYGILIRREYFENTDKKWWMKFYSRSTFYREKAKACNKFLHFLR